MLTRGPINPKGSGDRPANANGNASPATRSSEKKFVAVEGGAAMT